MRVAVRLFVRERAARLKRPPIKRVNEGDRAHRPYHPIAPTSPLGPRTPPKSAPTQIVRPHICFRYTHQGTQLGVAATCDQHAPTHPRGVPPGPKFRDDVNVQPARANRRPTHLQVRTSSTPDHAHSLLQVWRDNLLRSPIRVPMVMHDGRAYPTASTGSDADRVTERIA